MLTIEQAANEHTSGGWTDDKIVSFKAGVEFAQIWIQIQDELPKIDLIVECKSEPNQAYFSGKIVLSKEDKMFTKDRLLVEGMWHGVGSIDLLLNFTHWRPITIE